MGGSKVRASLAQAADGVKVIKRGASPLTADPLVCG